VLRTPTSPFSHRTHSSSSFIPCAASTAPRTDAYIKPFFSVPSLAEAREKAARLGGSLRPANEERTARGFRACEGFDPDGNLVQFRQEAG